MTRLVCWLRGHRSAIHLCQPPNGTPSLVICERCRTVLAEYARLAAEPSDLPSRYGALLAERDRLIADGVDPADLDVPEESR